jgi:hypothetical protein
MSIRRWLLPIVIGLGSVLLLIGALHLRPSVAQPIGPLNPIDLSPDAAPVAASDSAGPVSSSPPDHVDLVCNTLVLSRTVRVSAHSNGTPGNLGSGPGKISADGRHVAFYSAAKNLIGSDLDGDGVCEVEEGCDTNNVGDVFVHDRQTKQTTRVSVSTAGAEGYFRSGYYGFSISADGRYVAFHSSRYNWTGDPN